MWAYEARRIFRDQLVGDKAWDKFESILASVLQADWSVDLSSSETEGSAFYVTWGHTSSASDLSVSFGRQLGRLSAGDMEEIVAKAIISYGRLTSFCYHLDFNHVCMLLDICIHTHVSIVHSASVIVTSLYFELSITSHLYMCRSGAH